MHYDETVSYLSVSVRYLYTHGYLTEIHRLQKEIIKPTQRLMVFGED